MTDSDPIVWHKSTHSGYSGCVEVAFFGERVLVRDSKDRRGPVLSFTSMEWRTFLRGARNGEFDPPAGP